MSNSASGLRTEEQTDRLTKGPGTSSVKLKVTCWPSKHPVALASWAGLKHIDPEVFKKTRSNHVTLVLTARLGVEMQNTYWLQSHEGPPPGRIASHAQPQYVTVISHQDKLHLPFALLKLLKRI